MPKHNSVQRVEFYFGIILILNLLYQRCTNPGYQVVRANNFVRYLLIFERPQYGTCFMLPFWRMEF